MKTRTDEEIEEVRQLNAEVARIESVIRQMSPEKRAYCIIKSFFETEDHDEDTRNQFHRWLFSPGYEEAKDKAMERCFNEAMEGCFENAKDNYFNDGMNGTNKKAAIV